MIQPRGVADAAAHSPWQAVLRLDGQVGSAAFALLGIGGKGDVLGHGDIDVHLIVVVGHDDVF